MLEELTPRQLEEWRVYAELIEPIGEERADLRMGILAAVTANLWRGKRGRKAKPLDFMPFRESPRITDPDDIEDYFRSLCRR
jgi:hypothetical protein